MLIFFISKIQRLKNFVGNVFIFDVDYFSGINILLSIYVVLRGVFKKWD